MAKVVAVAMQMSGCNTPGFSPLDTSVHVPVSEKLLLASDLIIYMRPSFEIRTFPGFPGLILKAQRSSLLNPYFRKGAVMGQEVSHLRNVGLLLQY